jgi:2-oxoglutarate dehydrogenase E1 component
MRYRKAKDWVWVQEESLNMGAWTFMEPRLRAMEYPVKYVGRDASASPATGSHLVHAREQKELVEAAVVKAVPHLVRAAGSVPSSPITELQAAIQAESQTVNR